MIEVCCGRIRAPEVNSDFFTSAENDKTFSKNVIRSRTDNQFYCFMSIGTFLLRLKYFMSGGIICYI